MNTPPPDQNGMNSLAKRIQKQAENYVHQKINEANLTLAESLPIGKDDILPFGVRSPAGGEILTTIKVWCTADDSNLVLHLKLTKRDGSVELHDRPITNISELPLNFIDPFISLMNEDVSE